jgi:hypothetical protein
MEALILLLRVSTISMGENINWVALMLGHKSPVITLERYNRFVPNLTRLDGAALLGSVQKSETVRYGSIFYTIISTS